MKIEPRIAIAKAAFNKKNNISHDQLGRKFKEETSKALHLGHSFVWY
jgi:hypothetical protein